MKLIPKLNPAITYKQWPVNPEILNYPKWKQNIPTEVTEAEFSAAWKLLFGFDFNDCIIDAGDVEIFGNTLRGMITIQAPFAIHYRPFDQYIDDPVLAEDQTFYYTGYGCSWSTDAIGQKFYLINPKTSLPDDWDDVKAWETVKKYKPFIANIGK